MSATFPVFTRCRRAVAAALLAAGLALLLRPGAARADAEAEQKTILLMGHWRARDAFAGVPLPMSAVGAATAAAGAERPVTSGTVSTTAEGQPTRYEPAPADRLVWKRPGGPAVEFQFTEVRGDLRNGGRDFLRSDYTVRFRVAVEGQLEVEVAMTRRGGGYQAHLKGWMTRDGGRYDVDLTMRGQDYFESSYGGFERRDDHRITGTVAGAGREMTVDETYHFASVGSEGDVVTFDWLKLNNKLVAEGRTYQWDGVFLKKNFRNGRASGADRQPSDWVCEGQVLAGGRPFATYGRDYTAGGTHLRYKIDSPAGTIEVGRWQ